MGQRGGQDCLCLQARRPASCTGRRATRLTAAAALLLSCFPASILFVQGARARQRPYPQCSCALGNVTEGCGFLVPYAELVNTPPYIPGQAAPCLLLDSWLRQEQPYYSILLPVHNQEKIIGKNLRSLLKLTTGVWELVIVFDGCSDRSIERAKAVVTQAIAACTHGGGGKTPAACVNQGLARVALVEQRTPVFETTSNNIALRATTFGSRFLILVQDDMQVTEVGWNALLALPAQHWSDVFAVSGRCAHMRYSVPRLPQQYVGRCGADVDHPLATVSRTFHIRDTVNRGPLLLTALRVRELGYFDELNFHQGDDDHDLMTRAWFQKGWVAGAVLLNFTARLADGNMRKDHHRSPDEERYLAAREARKTGGFVPPAGPNPSHDEDRPLPSREEGAGMRHRQVDSGNKG